MEINGKKVVDATKPLTITIKPCDIHKGNNKDPGACAAAQALMRQEHVTHARVHLSRTYLYRAGKWVRYATPKSIRTEIVAFDRGAKFAPGEYTLPPLKPSTRKLRGKGVGSNTGRNRKKKDQIARKKHHVVSGVRHTLVK